MQKINNLRTTAKTGEKCYIYIEGENKRTKIKRLMGREQRISEVSGNVVPSVDVNKSSTN